MTRTGDKIRRFLSTGVATLMLSLSVAVPFMERAELVDEPVAESEHNPATCPPPHDHRLCTQVGANLAVPAASDERPLPASSVLRIGRTTRADAVSSAHADDTRSRAPPLA